MKELIERLRVASKPSRELFEAAYVARFGAVDWGIDGNWHPFRQFLDFLAVSAWTDAALTLVEPKSAWAVSHSPDEDPASYPRPYRATVMPDLAYSGRRDVTAHHDSPAIALCIAALLAIAATDRTPPVGAAPNDSGGQSGQA